MRKSEHGPGKSLGIIYAERGGTTRAEQRDRFKVVICQCRRRRTCGTGRSPCWVAATFKCGSSDWTRTSNHSINSRVLCQLSYGGLSAIGRSPRRDYQIAQRRSLDASRLSQPREVFVGPSAEFRVCRVDPRVEHNLPTDFVRFPISAGNQRRATFADKFDARSHDDG